MLENQENIIQWLEANQIREYRITPEFIVNVFEDVVLNGLGLDEIPIQFGFVNGSFDISKNRLTSLKGCPYKVKGDFIASHNLLKSLEFAPLIVKQTYDVSYNELIAFDQKMKQGVEHLIISGNKIKTLAGMPQIKKTLRADFNLLESLEGCPNELEALHVSHNRLRTLQGGSQSVFGKMDCANNFLENLVGAPHHVQEFDASFNQLVSLEGCPSSVSKLSLNNNLIDSMAYLPEKVDDLYLHHNLIYKDTKYPPQVFCLLIHNNPIDYMGYLGENISYLDISHTNINTIDGLASYINTLCISEIHSEMLESIVDNTTSFVRIKQSEHYEEYDAKEIESLSDVVNLKRDLDNRLEHKPLKKGHKI